MNQANKNQLVEHFFRHSHARMVAILVNYFGLDQVEIAEDIVQDTLIEAMEKWSVSNIPNNPEGWLMDVAKKKTINLLKRKQLFDTKIAKNLSQSIKNQDATATADSTLKMIFACCHPKLPPESQVALALKTLCGLSIPEISNSLLTTEENINKRLYRARKKFRDGTINYELPSEDVSRLDNVLHVLYLLFNEGCFSLHKEEKIRLDLCYEAIRLLKEVESGFGAYAKVQGLLALMYFSIARFESRIDPMGELILLEEQDRNLWDQQLIAQGMHHLSKSIESDDPNKYQLQAGILAEHCLAVDFQSTNWKGILKQYELLAHIDPQPIVQFNKSIAGFFAGNEEESLAELKKLENDAYFVKNAQFHLAKAILLHKVHENKEAEGAFSMAMQFASSENEKKLVQHRMHQLRST